MAKEKQDIESDEPEGVYSDQYDWCYKAANQFCADKLQLADMIRHMSPVCDDKTFRDLIIGAQVEHGKLFEAFVRGAVWGAKYGPKEPRP